MPVLESDERFVFETFANREVSPIRNIGGMLFVTSERLYFAPNFLERWIGRKPWEMRRENVEAVRLLGRNARKALSGGLTTRVEVEFSDGHTERFVVQDEPGLIAALS